MTEARLGVSHRDWHIHAKNRQTGTQKETALQIHRFYTAMRYGKDVYGVKMTVREKRSGATVFYTLEAHELDVQKINPETESPRGGVVKAALPGRSPTIKYNNFFEKFKPVNDLLGFKYKEKYPDVRFSLADYSTDDQNDIVAILKPFVGRNAFGTADEYASYLREHGVDIPEKDAFLFAKIAARQVLPQRIIKNFLSRQFFDLKFTPSPVTLSAVME